MVAAVRQKKTLRQPIIFFNHRDAHGNQQNQKEEIAWHSRMAIAKHSSSSWQKEEST